MASSGVSSEKGNGGRFGNVFKFRRTPMEFLKKYLFEGQALQDSYQQELENIKLDALPWHKRVWIKYRRIFGMLIPALFFHLFWWAYFIKFNHFDLFNSNYRISIMAVFGSLIAGLTSEGGGSVAFPVMTLAFKIKPHIARDFTLLIQSCGMTAAMFTVFWMKIRIEWRAIVFCSFGGLFGIILALEDLDTRITPPVKKMGFVSLFFAFAFALFLLNRVHKRTTFKKIPQFNWWKALILIVVGFVGGIFTGLSGTGIDICCFSILTLLFRVTEKTATPTSIVLMALNSVMGMYWRAIMSDTPVSLDAWQYVGVAIPIVVVGAPLGSLIGSHFHRQALASLNYITDTVALISGFAIVKPDKKTVGISLGIIFGGFLFYIIITLIGGKLMSYVLSRQQRESPDDDRIEKEKETTEDNV
eukprot:TCONS_00072695-protein